MKNQPANKTSIHINVYSNADTHISHAENSVSIRCARDGALGSNVTRTHTTNVAPQIGSVWPGEGGVYAGIIRDGDRQWHLILATEDPTAFHGPWGGFNKSEPNACSVIDGLANTQALLASENDHPLVHQIAALTIEGHNDFYLPAKKENNLLYINLPGELAETWHWSSTQYSANRAWIQGFSVGFQHIGSKRNEYAARAVRRLPIK